LTDFEDFVGLTEEQAVASAKERGLMIRVVCEDGEFFFGTSDYVDTRLNIDLTKGIVSSVRGIG
jgi:hypothetical protein